MKSCFDEGDIYIQFFDQPFIFYSEGGWGESGSGLDIRQMDKRGGYLNYFNDIESVDISENEYYQRRVVEIEADVEEIDVAIVDLQQRKEKLLKFIRID